MGGWPSKKQGGVVVSPRLERRLAKHATLMADRRVADHVKATWQKPGSNKKS